jgi:D-arginine dehydrogenase
VAEHGNGLLTVDVAVIGGGMAGVSVAAELAATHTVALLEQEDQLAHHATGRSAAMFLESYGQPVVRELTRASRPLMDAASEAGDVSILTPRPLLWVALPGQEDLLVAAVEHEQNLQRLDVGDARALCPVLRSDRVAGAAVEPDAQDIDVAALHQWYLREARRRGVTVLAGHGLEAATREEPSAWRLRHRAGDVIAPVVVDAAGAWADQVAALFGARPQGLEPRRRTIAIGRSHEPLPPTTPMVCDVGDTFYFRPEGPHVLLSPADETPTEPCDARPEEADVALAVERVNDATTLDIRSVASTWAGLRTFAPDRNPVVGYDPEAPGFFWLAGQGGTGIQMAPALARLAAELVLDPDRRRPPDAIAPRGPTDLRRP